MWMSADGVVLRAGCDDVPTTLRPLPTTLRPLAYYAPTTAYYAPTTAYYAPTTAYYAPTHCLLRSDHCLLRSDHCLLSNFGVLRPNHGILRGQWLLRRWLLRRLQSRRIVRHWRGRLGRSSWNRPKVGSSRVVNGEDVAARSLRGFKRRENARLANILCKISIVDFQPVIAPVSAAIGCQ